MNGELRDRVLLAAGAVVAVVISYTLYTQLQAGFRERAREAVSRPPEPLPKAAPIPGLSADGKLPYLDPSATGVRLNAPISPPVTPGKSAK